MLEDCAPSSTVAAHMCSLFCVAELDVSRTSIDYYRRILSPQCLQDFNQEDDILSYSIRQLSSAWVVLAVANGASNELGACAWLHAQVQNVQGMDINWQPPTTRENLAEKLQQQVIVLAKHGRLDLLAVRAD
jgi:hypothetical protein